MGICRGNIYKSIFGIILTNILIQNFLVIFFSILDIFKVNKFFLLNRNERSEMKVNIKFMKIIYNILKDFE